MKAAIMQPYFLPYFGYFSLVHSADIFIFYDDVAFIKKGWINRNKILVNNIEFVFTIPLKDSSQNKLINEIFIHEKSQWEGKFIKTIERAYKRAPYYSEIFPIIESIIKYKTDKVSELAQNSITSIANYLDLKTIFKKSSEIKENNNTPERADRLIEICKSQSCFEYNNSIGGRILYSQEYFANHGIELKFVNPQNIQYKQFSSNFISNLSILDVLMFNSKEDSIKLICSYDLVGN